MRVCLSNQKFHKSSIKGNGHSLAEGNQDSCLAFAFKDGVVLGIADGVGSCKHPQIASKTAMKCLSKTARDFSKKEFGEIDFADYFLRQYKMMHSSFLNGMSTTLVFAVIYKDCRIVYGQIGDGMLMSSFGERFAIFKKKNDDFTNITPSLRYDTVASDIIVKCRRIEMPGVLKVLLCTDGVSEDLIPESYDVFLEKVTSLVSFDRTDEIDKLLKEWPTAKSLDDKTIVAARIEFEGV